ncbi:unnamed protein product, partial [Ectocarpus sp. 12 AP-2014]
AAAVEGPHARELLSPGVTILEGRRDRRRTALRRRHGRSVDARHRKIETLRWYRRAELDRLLVLVHRRDGCPRGVVAATSAAAGLLSAGPAEEKPRASAFYVGGGRASNVELLPDNHDGNLAASTSTRTRTRAGWSGWSLGSGSGSRCGVSSWRNGGRGRAGSRSRRHRRLAADIVVAERVAVRHQRRLAAHEIAKRVAVYHQRRREMMREWGLFLAPTNASAALTVARWFRRPAAAAAAFAKKPRSVFSCLFQGRNGHRGAPHTTLGIVGRPRALAPAAGKLDRPLLRMIKRRCRQRRRRRRRRRSCTLRSDGGSALSPPRSYCRRLGHRRRRHHRVRSSSKP